MPDIRSCNNIALNASHNLQDIRALWIRTSPFINKRSQISFFGVRALINQEHRAGQRISKIKSNAVEMAENTNQQYAQQVRDYLTFDVCIQRV